MTYSAADIIDKTLFAATRVPIKRQPWDSAPVVSYAAPGQKIGVVYTYQGIRPGRSVLYWGFIDGNNIMYYTEHREGYYNLQSLRGQGLLTLEEKQQQEELAKLSLPERVVRTATRGLLLYGVIRLAARFIK